MPGYNLIRTDHTSNKKCGNVRFSALKDINISYSQEFINFKV